MNYATCFHFYHSSGEVGAYQLSCTVSENGTKVLLDCSLTPVLVVRFNPDPAVPSRGTIWNREPSGKPVMPVHCTTDHGGYVVIVQ